MPIYRFSRACAVFARLCCAALPFVASCSVGPEVVSVWGGDIVAPELKSLSVDGEESLSVDFSAPVTVRDASVTVPSDGRQFTASWTPLDGGKSASFAVSGSPGVGVRAFLSGSVSDGKGSTLTFSVPFTGYNPRPASLAINEVRTEYSSKDIKTKSPSYKIEFIEFYVRGAGNLGGIQVCNPLNKKFPTYEFVPVEVSVGDFVVLHFRSVEEGLVNESGAIDASAGCDSSPFARDFWDAQKTEPLKDNNVILIRERDGGPIMDALLFALDTVSAWPFDAVTLAATEAVAAGQWKPGATVAEAFRYADKGYSATSTIGRDEKSTDTDTAADWAVSGTSKCSPGKANPAR